MSDATAAVSLNTQIAQNKRRPGLIVDSSHEFAQLGQAIGQMHAETQAKAEAEAHFVNDLGADPAEAKRVIATGNPQMLSGYYDRLMANRRVKHSLDVLGYSANGGAAPAGSPAPIPTKGTEGVPAFNSMWNSPSTSAAPAADGSVPTSPGATWDSMWNDPNDPARHTPAADPLAPAVTPGGGPAAPRQPGNGVLPNTSPSAWPSRQELLRRYAGGAGGGDAAALQTAMGFLPKEISPLDQSEIDARAAQATRDRAEATRPRAWEPTNEAEYLRAHPHNPPAPPPVPNPDHRILTPGHAKSMGLPAEWADGETTVGEAMTRAGQTDVGKPGKPAGERGTKATNFNTPLSPTEEQQFQDWKRQYAPNDSGTDYDLRGAFKAGLTPDPQSGHWPDTFKKPNHPTFSNQSIYAADEPGLAGSWDGDKFIPHQDPLANIGRELGVQRSQREAQDYESPAYKDAKKRYDTLIAKGTNLREVALYPGGKKQLEADVNAAKAAMEAAKAAPAPGVARPNFPPVVPPAPPAGTSDEQPTQEDIDFEAKRGNVWDPAKKGFVTAPR